MNEEQTWGGGNLAEEAGCDERISSQLHKVGHEIGEEIIILSAFWSTIIYFISAFVYHKYHYSHFTDQETEAEKVKRIAPNHTASKSRKPLLSLSYHSSNSVYRWHVK